MGNTKRNKDTVFLLFCMSHESRVTERFDGTIRLVCGTVPYRPSTKTFLMILSNNYPFFVFPKGGWDVGESEEECAVRETFEEAGVKGMIEKLGQYDFVSGKGNSTRLTGFLLNVEEVCDVYLEAQVRIRRWFSKEEAIKQASNRPEMKQILNDALQLIEKREKSIIQ